MKNILYKIKIKIDKIIDIATYKQQIKILQNEVNELRKKELPLIDLKNKYLADLRTKNLKLARLEKENERLKKENEELKERQNYAII